MSTKTSKATKRASMPNNHKYKEKSVLCWPPTPPSSPSTNEDDNGPPFSHKMCHLCNGFIYTNEPINQHIQDSHKYQLMTDSDSENLQNEIDLMLENYQDEDPYKWTSNSNNTFFDKFERHLYLKCKLCNVRMKENYNNPRLVKFTFHTHMKHFHNPECNFETCDCLNIHEALVDLLNDQ